MSFNAQKTPFQRTMNRFVEGKVQDGASLAGKSWPCHVTAVNGSIVTVAFDVASPFTLPQVTMPIFGPEYIRYPIQVGDKGITLAADVYIGNASGLGGGAASNLATRGNLSVLVFLPIGNLNWTPTEDPNALVLYTVNRKTGTSFHESGEIRTWGQEEVDGSVSTTGNLSAGTGSTGTFQSADGQTVSVVDGIIVGLA